jgi:hypothetical protein
MKVVINKMPTEARRNSFFSTFKGSKRAQWAAYRAYNR